MFMAIVFKGMLRIVLSLCVILGFSLSTGAWAASSNVDGVRVLYYRYIDENGTRSTSSTIPPKYAQKGYEIVTRSGKIIKVPPAPDPALVQKAEEELARQRKETADYEILARRYSSVQDIYAARDRRLTHLNASIAILQSNIESINRQISELTTKAANSERAGRSVSPQILTALADTRSELATTESKLKMRTLEHDEIHQSFEEDVKLFEKGRAFMEARRADATRDGE